MCRLMSLQNRMVLREKKICQLLLDGIAIKISKWAKQPKS